VHLTPTIGDHDDPKLLKAAPVNPCEQLKTLGATDRKLRHPHGPTSSIISALLIPWR
jgi:hypothetical protein